MYYAAQAPQNEFSMLFKFGDKKDLFKLQKGSLYMKNLRYYNELEKKMGKIGIGDLYDGKCIFSNANVIIAV